MINRRSNGCRSSRVQNYLLAPILFHMPFATITNYTNNNEISRTRLKTAITRSYYMVNTVRCCAVLWLWLTTTIHIFICGTKMQATWGLLGSFYSSEIPLLNPLNLVLLSSFRNCWRQKSAYKKYRVTLLFHCLSISLYLSSTVETTTSYTPPLLLPPYSADQLNRLVSRAILIGKDIQGGSSRI